METPVAIVHASLALIPRFTAEESFLVASRTAVGSGTLKPEDAQQVTSEWTRLAEHARKAVVRRPTASDLAAVGIAVIEVPRG